MTKIPKKERLITPREQVNLDEFFIDTAQARDTTEADEYLISDAQRERERLEENASLSKEDDWRVGEVIRGAKRGKFKNR